MKILVTGGRNFKDWHTLDVILTRAHNEFGERLCIVQGGARGADQLARLWCAENGVACITMDAMWDYYGRQKAGPIRNAWMLKHTTPSHVIAFPGGSGTANMCKLAKKQGTPVTRITQSILPVAIPL